MKKNIKFKNKILALCASLLVFSLSFLPVFGNEKTTVRAENVVNPVISGNIFITVGDGLFSPLIGNNSSLSFRVYDGSTFISSCFVNEDGQFYLQLHNYSGSTSLICKISDMNSNAEYIYMFNDRTNSLNFGVLSENLTFFNCYFRYYPITRDLTAPVQNYVYNSIYCDTGGDNFSSARLSSPGFITDYNNSFDFVYTLEFEKKYGTYPACWININDNSNEFVAGLGVIGAYGGSTTQFPWKFYVKDNVSGSKVLIEQFAQADFPKFKIKLKLHTYQKDKFVFIEYYYSTSITEGIWTFFERVMLTKNAFIKTVTVQPSSCACSLTYALDYRLKEPAPVNLTYAKQLGYDEGYTAGQEYGYNVGYNAGLEFNKYSFWDLTSAIIDVPVKTLTDLFDVEILGVNMKSFIFSIATIIIVLVVVRIWLGSRGV